MKTIEQEIAYAREKYGAFNSTHELAAVLKEEYDEFWEIVRKRPIWDRDVARRSKATEMINELTQIAAIALRGIQELKNNEIKFV